MSATVSVNATASREPLFFVVLVHSVPIRAPIGLSPFSLGFPSSSESELAFLGVLTFGIADAKS